MGVHAPISPNANRAKDFGCDQTAVKQVIQVQNGINVYFRKCLTSFLVRPIDPKRVVVVLDGIVAERDTPTHLRTGNGPWVVASILLSW